MTRRWRCMIPPRPGTPDPTSQQHYFFPVGKALSRSTAAAAAAYPRHCSLSRIQSASNKHVCQVKVEDVPRRAWDRTERDKYVRIGTTMMSKLPYSARGRASAPASMSSSTSSSTCPWPSALYSNMSRPEILASTSLSTLRSSPSLGRPSVTQASQSNESGSGSLSTTSPPLPTLPVLAQRGGGGTQAGLDAGGGRVNAGAWVAAACRAGPREVACGARSRRAMPARRATVLPTNSANIPLNLTRASAWMCRRGVMARARNA